VSPVRAVLWGGLTVGALDLADAFIFFGLRGVAPVRILQSIASGALGRAAFSEGLAAAALGVAVHFFVATSIVFVCYLASAVIRSIVRHPFVFGPIYGWIVYAFMNLVVIPLSRAGPSRFVWPVVLNGLAIHALGVGIPSAWFARLARRGRSS
jgi:hypothetical protein